LSVRRLPKENFEKVKEVKLEGDCVAVHRCFAEFSATILKTGILK